jgi:hypothetical protein
MDFRIAGDRVRKWHNRIAHCGFHQRGNSGRYYAPDKAGVTKRPLSRASFKRPTTAVSAYPWLGVPSHILGLRAIQWEYKD